MCTVRTENVSQPILLEGIPGLSGFRKNAVTALVSEVGHHEILGIDNRLKATVHFLVGKAVDDKSRSIELDNHLFYTNEDVRSSPIHLTMVTKAICKKNVHLNYHRGRN